MADKTMMANAYEFTDETMTLYFAMFANGNPFLYFGKWAYKALGSDSTAIKITGLHQRYMLAKPNIFYLRCINGGVHAWCLFAE